MKKFLCSIVAGGFAAAVAVMTAVPAFAAEGPGARSAAGFVTQQQQVSTHDIVPMATWAIVAIAVACLVGGIMYFFKHRIGAYPKNPTWVAPISIMLSRDLPGDDESHEAHADSTHDITAHGAAPTH